MGIINITPDSLYGECAAMTDERIRARVAQIVSEGADFIDIGAYSTRPGCREVSVDEELRRLERGLRIIREVSTDIVVSVDTFRAEVARKAIKEMSADMINDISGGRFDQNMAQTVADLKVPYILTHSRGDMATMHTEHHYDDLMADIVRDLATEIARLHLLGVCDIIVDPGFGFGKTLDENYHLMRHLHTLTTLGQPLLVGVSRKSMITRVLGIDAEAAQNGTTALNTYALTQGASILRVHDVKAAKEVCTLYQRL